MKRSNHYFKPQTKWTRIPAAIEAHRCSETVAVRLHPARNVTDDYAEPACIWLDANEAQAFAAWLSQQADALAAKQAKAAARKAARQAAKEGKQ
jgi:hypothetical protein